MRHAGAVNGVAPRVVIGLGDSRRLAALMARVLASRLDRQLAGGVEPWRSWLHAARATQLTGERSRRTLARCLERLVERAEETPALYRSGVIPPNRPRVREARPVMLTLASRLRGGGAVDAHSLALLKRVLTDGAGPCYMPGDPNTLKLLLQAIAESLDVGD